MIKILLILVHVDPNIGTIQVYPLFHGSCCFVGWRWWCGEGRDGHKNMEQRGVEPLAS